MHQYAESEKLIWQITAVHLPRFFFFFSRTGINVSNCSTISQMTKSAKCEATGVPAAACLSENINRTSNCSVSVWLKTLKCDLLNWMFFMRWISPRKKKKICIFQCQDRCFLYLEAPPRHESMISDLALIPDDQIITCCALNNITSSLSPFSFHIFHREMDSEQPVCTQWRCASFHLYHYM